MSSPRAKQPPWELDPKQLRAGIIRRVERSTELQTELAFAAIPALLDHYVSKCEALFQLVARPLQGSQRANFRSLLSQALETGFEASAHAKVVVRVRSDPPPALSLTYEVGVQTRDISDVYATWIRESSTAYFGVHPDAKVMAVARDVARPEACALDIGAGTGRNAIPLATSGFTVDAVELTPGFVAELREAAKASCLALNAIEGDAFDPELKLPAARYALIVASEVISSHLRDAADLREFMEFASKKLTPGGKLVCNAFLARPGYSPDALARQSSPSVLSSVFSEADLDRALTGLPLTLISNESCAEYEKTHLPTEAWPPTSWFEAWASGGNLFDLPGRAPIELRWLVCRKETEALTQN